MNNIKIQIKSSKYVISIYTIYSIIWFILHLECARIGDDLVWAERAKVINSFSDLISNYWKHISIWSSRFLIDFVGRLVELSPMIVWRFIDTVVFVFLTYQLDRMFNEERDIRITVLVMSICCIFPFLHLSSAGWMAATFTYLWPLALMLYAVRTWIKLCEGKKICPWQYVLSVLAYLYAIDQQQIAVCATLLCIMAIVILRRKTNSFLVGISVLTVVRMIFHLKWPGNEQRIVLEICNWFPNYEMMSVLDKLQIGVSTTFHKIFFEGDMIFLLTSMMLAIIVFEKFNDFLHRGIILIPNVLLFLWGPLQNVFSKYLSGFFSINEEYSPLYGMVHNGNYPSKKAYLAFLICGTAIICIIVSIIAIFEVSKSSVVYSSVLVIGLCSRIMMGFSPTVYASGVRTYLFLYFAFLLLIIAFAKKIIDENIKGGKWILNFTILLGGLSLINNSILIPTIR